MVIEKPTTTTSYIKSSNFHPDLNHRAIRSGRYLLPKRKLPARLNSAHRGNPASIRPQIGSGTCNIKYKEIIDSRPPLRPDLSTPGPWAYNPHYTKPLNETNAPSYTMRPRCWSEKDLGGRTSWSKTWYQSPRSGPARQTLIKRMFGPLLLHTMIDWR
ncbi:C9orf173 [Bugula neritina]|uniref:C9orf173 n=1 Tax=Bugula neritina TaxID=10212 RepID=A0A7J7JJE4_BUGNE|nr:C9orf173 [Bugula neritina]